MSGLRLASVCLSALTMITAGCGVTGSRAHLRNLTDTPVAVHVNGAWVGTYPPGAIADVPIGGEAATYSIEVLSPSGSRLASIALSADQLDEVEGGTMSLGANADVPCGTVAIWVGPEPPEQGVNLDPSVPLGPCP